MFPLFTTSVTSCCWSKKSGRGDRFAFSEWSFDQQWGMIPILVYFSVELWLMHLHVTNGTYLLHCTCQKNKYSSWALVIHTSYSIRNVCFLVLKISSTLLTLLKINLGFIRVPLLVLVYGLLEPWPFSISVAHHFLGVDILPVYDYHTGIYR